MQKSHAHNATSKGRRPPLTRSVAVTVQTRPNTGSLSSTAPSLYASIHQSDVFRVPLDQIILEGGVRDEALVNATGESLKAVGLLMPVVLRPEASEGAAVPRLVCVDGRVRVHAAIRAGWQDIDATILDLDETSARLFSLTTKVFRSAIEYLDRAEAFVAWLELVQRRLEVLQVTTPGGKQPAWFGLRRAAKEWNIDPGTASRLRKVGLISEEAKEAARAEGLTNNLSALLEIAESSDQIGAVKERAQRAALRTERTLRKKRSLPKAEADSKSEASAPAIPEGSDDGRVIVTVPSASTSEHVLSEEDQCLFAALMDAWNAAPDMVRRRFLTEVRSFQSENAKGVDQEAVA